MYRRNNPSARADFQHKDVLKTQRRGALLFGYFLLGTQEKVTRATARNALLLAVS